MLSSSFRCDQIYKYEKYDFGHTLLCYLSRTYMFNKPTRGRFVEQKLMLNSNFRGDQNNNNCHGFRHTRLCCLSPTYVFNKPTYVPVGFNLVSKASILNKSSCRAPALGVTTFIVVRNIILVRLCCAT